MSDRLFYQAIGNSIQENKDKIEKLEEQNKRLKKLRKKLKDNYEKAINLLVNNDLLPCEQYDDFDEKYCSEHCTNADSKCWKHYIEKCYELGSEEQTHE